MKELMHINITVNEIAHQLIMNDKTKMHNYYNIKSFQNVNTFLNNERFCYNMGLGHLTNLE